MNQPFSPPQSRAPVSGSRIAVAPATRDHAGAARHSGRVRLLRVLLPIAVIAGAGVYALSLRGAEETEQPIDPPVLDAEILAEDAMVMEAPRMAGFQADGEPYRVEAERATQSVGNADVVELETVSASFAMDDGNAHVTADRGLYDTRAATLTLEGGVTIATDAGLTARFGAAQVALDTGTITSNEPVAIESDGRIIRGNRLVITEGGDALSLTDGVILTAGDGTQPATDGAGLFGGLGAAGAFEISADSLEQTMVEGQPRFTFSGEVAAIRGDTTIAAPTMIVSAASTSQGAGAGFERMIAGGGVTIDTGGRRVTGSDAEIDLAAGSVRVSGGITIRDGESTLAGERMTADMAAGTLTVEGGRVRFFSPGAGGGGGGGAFGAFRTGSGGSTEITADRFTQAPRENGDVVLTFTGNVVADRGGSVVRSPTLTVLAPGGDGSANALDSAGFQRIEASGGVSVIADGQTATGSNAVFNMAAGTIVMTGAVSVSDGNQTLSGDRLTVDMNSGVMTMEPLTRAIITPRAGAGLP